MMTDLFRSGDHETELSVEERQGLIPSVSTRAQLNAIERLNINSARVWAMRKTNLQRSDLVTDEFARDLHRRMFNQVWRWAGRYRATQKNMGWEPHQISEGMRNVFQDVGAWIAHETFDVVEMAVRLHHRLVVIHGRHARLMADVFVAVNGGGELTWGAGSDLTSTGDVRERYISALRQADDGDFAPLIAFAAS
jgi:Fic-DOC domain mobile mystery protein B